VGSNRNYSDGLPKGHQRVRANSKLVSEDKSLVMVFCSPSKILKCGHKSVVHKDGQGRDGSGLGDGVQTVQTWSCTNGIPSM
jgi:hypothetical protein